MYSEKVTVFNFYESSTASIWYPHVLFGVDLITDRGQLIQRYGPDNSDNASLHIAFSQIDGQMVIVNSQTGALAENTLGEPLPWLPPKAWKEQVNDLLDDTITFSPGDFFWAGEWAGGAVNDADYSDRRQDGFYAFMNNKYDFVYKITSVGGPYTVIPHFEVLGA